MSSTTQNIDLLNRLAGWHGSTMASYLLDAAPWQKASSVDGFKVVRAIAHDQQRMRGRISEEIQNRGGAAERPLFPMAFTSLHDLSLEYLLGRVITDQRHLESQIRGILPGLAGDPPGLALAEESLGEALAHLDALREIPAPA